MLGINFFKADSSTFVIKAVNGQTRKKGKGLSFLYNAATSSIAAIPINAQEAPFIFKLLTADLDLDRPRTDHLSGHRSGKDGRDIEFQPEK